MKFNVNSKNCRNAKISKFKTDVLESVETAIFNAVVIEVRIDSTDALAFVPALAYQAYKLNEEWHRNSNNWQADGIDVDETYFCRVFYITDNRAFLQMFDRKEMYAKLRAHQSLYFLFEKQKQLNGIYGQFEQLLAQHNVHRRTLTTEKNSDVYKGRCKKTILNNEKENFFY